MRVDCIAGARPNFVKIAPILRALKAAGLGTQLIHTAHQIATPNPDWSGDAPDPATSKAPFRIFNIGNSASVQFTEYIEAIEDLVGKKSIKQLLPLQPGDVLDTYADVSELISAVGYKPAISVREGVARFVRGIETITGREAAGKQHSGYLRPRVSGGP